MGAKKAKKGERELCRQLHERGYGAQRSGSLEFKHEEDHPDITTSLTHLYFEVKRGYSDKKLWGATVQGWFDKAEGEAFQGTSPVVAWRPNYGTSQAAPDGWFFLVPARFVTPSLSDGPAGMARYVVSGPWVVIPGVDAFVETVDPQSAFVVSGPDDWTP